MIKNKLGRKYKPRIKLPIVDIEKDTKAFIKADNSPENCPHCKVSLLNGLVPKEYGATPGSMFKKEIGVEVPDIYDGVYFYVCPECFFEFGGYRALMAALEI